MSNKTESTPAAVKDISIDPSEFDRNKVVIHDPKTSSFTIGDAPVENTFSDGRYLNDNGEECELYIPAPPQNCFGINYVYDLNLKKEQQVPENAKTLQVCYSVTSMKTLDEPTPREKDFIDLVQALWELAVQKGREESEREEPRIPAPSVASCMAAEKQKKMDRFVKPPMEYPKSKDKKTPDRTKPKRMYVKLVTSGKGPTLRALTKFFGPGDKPVSAFSLIDKRGILEPCFKWEGIYWGSHGPTAPHGASLRFKLVEANYTPQASTAIPSHRMLGKNNAPIQEEDEDFNTPNHQNAGEEEGFSEPGADDANPTSILSKTSKAKPPVKTTQKPVVKVTTKGPVLAKAPIKPAPVKKATVPAKPTAVKPKVPVRKVTPPPEPEDEPEDDVQQDPDEDQ